MNNKDLIAQYLQHLNIEQLNEMQAATLAASETHAAIQLLSATGSGKTLAFLLPVVLQLKKELKHTQAMIIAPSRELAMQIEQVFKQMGTGFKITCCYGGHKREIEENNLIEPPALIVGTPGRLADHIRRGNITHPSIEMLVLDEFDKILDLGFVDELQEIVTALSGINKIWLTSATSGVDIPAFLGIEQLHPINFLPDHPLSEEKLAIQYVQSTDKDKIDTLYQLICYLGGKSSIVFCNHREAVERTSQLLKEKGISSVFYHGAMEQRDRDSALSKFRNGSTLLLVTTDIAARGLDIPNIRYIIHYHLPQTEAIFTHRNGRTARMDASGTGILIIGPEESLPAYAQDASLLDINDHYPTPEKPKWTTFFIGAGKKDKVNKIDIVGFLTNRAQLKKEDIGLIEVKDFFSFVAIRKTKAHTILPLVQQQKIKNKKVKIEIAK